jgi:hypothetical protein
MVRQRLSDGIGLNDEAWQIRKHVLFPVAFKEAGVDV